MVEDSRTVLGLQGGDDSTSVRAEHCISVLSVGAAFAQRKELEHCISVLSVGLAPAAVAERPNSLQLEHCISVLSVSAAEVAKRGLTAEHCISVLSVGAQ